VPALVLDRTKSAEWRSTPIKSFPSAAKGGRFAFAAVYLFAIFEPNLYAESRN
jgi:hypothetical protein